jgi:hypothetical protein
MAEQQALSIALSGPDKGDGLFITDNGGNYYYLRPEILAHAKMTDEEIAGMKARSAKGQGRELNADDLQAVVGGSNVALPGVLHIGNVPSFKLPSGATMEGTVMCPW